MRVRTMILAAAAAVTAGLFALWTPIRAIESALFLLDNTHGGQSSLWRSLTSPPSTREITFAENGRNITGDLYTPAGTVRAAVVLAPGAAPLGRFEPRLIRLADGLARAGFAVFIPDMPELRQMRLSPDDVAFLADTCNGLTLRVGRDLAHGIVAISYAVGPAVLAGRQLRPSKGQSFVFGIGGYHDSTALIRYFTTGYHRAPNEQQWRQATPNPYGKWVFLLANAARVQNGADRNLLRHIAEARLADLDADIGDWFGALGLEGRAVFDVIANTDPDHVPRLIARLPDAIRADMERLNPAGQPPGDRPARLILVHGRDDRIIPYTESQALAERFGARADLYIVDSLGHVEFTGSALGTIVDLWRANMDLFALRH